MKTICLLVLSVAAFALFNGAQALTCYMCVNGYTLVPCPSSKTSANVTQQTCKSTTTNCIRANDNGTIYRLCDDFLQFNGSGVYFVLKIYYYTTSLFLKNGVNLTIDTCSNDMCNWDFATTTTTTTVITPTATSAATTTGTKAGTATTAAATAPTKTTATIPIVITSSSSLKNSQHTFKFNALIITIFAFVSILNQ